MLQVWSNLAIEFRLSMVTLLVSRLKLNCSSCRLMDADGSGAIGSDELSSAFEVGKTSHTLKLKGNNTCCDVALMLHIKGLNFWHAA